LQESRAQDAITMLIAAQDMKYGESFDSKGTAQLVDAPKQGEFAAGRPVFEAVSKSGRAIKAVNIVTYNQIEGHIISAIKQDAILILEVARSQLGYALDAKKVIEYAKEVMEKIIEFDKKAPTE